MKISIVTVVWNAADCIEQTLESVRSQDYNNIEYIVIDGKSTDGTIDIIKQYSDIITTFISEKDSGLYYAMNKGKTFATGDFVLFMNSGDIFLATSVISNIVACITDMDRLYYGNTILYYDNLRTKAVNLHHQSIFYPKSFYSKEGYKCEKYKIVAESNYTFRAIDLFPKDYCDVDIILSNLNGFGITRFSNWKSVTKIYKEMDLLMEEHRKDFFLTTKIKFFLRCIIKFLAFKLGGLRLAAIVTILRAKISTK